MTVHPLYKGGNASLSPDPSYGGVLSDMVRLIADDGYAITNGTAVVTCVDVLSSDVQMWSDIPLPIDPEDETA